MMKAEININSYGGANDDEKKDNRTWFHGVYAQVWPWIPDMEDLSGKAMTIDQSMRLLGRTIGTRDECTTFFIDSSRGAMIKDCIRWYKKTAAMVHPDKFQKRVTDEGMREKNENRFKALTTAKEALVEWDEVARDMKKRRKAAKGELALEYLVSWEGEIYIPKEDAFMDYKDFKQPKRQKTK
jgi:hypothetical protein